MFRFGKAVSSIAKASGLSKVAQRSFADASGIQTTEFRAILNSLYQADDFRVRGLLKGLNEEQINLAVSLAQRMNKVEDVQSFLEGELKDSGITAETLKAIKIAEVEKSKVFGQKAPVKVAVTGAAGAIGYAMLYRIANGEMLGKNQPVHLQLLELPAAEKALGGVAMELQDCAFPLLRSITTTTSAEKAFEDVDYAIFVGAKPRGPGMERADLMKDNAAIFQVSGKALNKTAKKSVRSLVVGNPANTNCLILAHNAPDIPAHQFSAMTRLDLNRAIGQLAEKTKAKNGDIDRVIIWGNHSSTQYPDIAHARIAGKWAPSVVNDDKWVKETFIPTVQKRGAAIIAARGASSAASAANAAIEHVRDLALGTYGDWTSMAVLSNGEYGVTKGLYSSFPVRCSNGNYAIVDGIDIDKYAAEKINLSVKELEEERNMVKSFLP